MDWATLQQRTFGADVWTCRCGGKREVLEVATSASAATELLSKLGIELPKRTLPTAQAPPQRELELVENWV